MAVINVAGSAAHEEQNGIRAFDIGRDLRPVAELIADAFSSELDPRGKAALREMRIMSHVSGLIKLMNRSTGEFNDIFNGYVWQEDGHIVGNVTVQRADKYGSRWQIANVAVERTYRGRGIARRLMAEAFAHANEAHGQWAVLQVYENNAVARQLYHSLGFEDVGAMVDLRLSQARETQAPETIPGFTRFSVHQWTSLYDLASAQLNTQAQWWRAVRRTDFQKTFDQQAVEWLWRRLGRTRIYRRAVRTSRRFDAAMILTAQGWRGNHKLEMWVRPELYGKYETPMVQWALHQLESLPRLPVDAAISASHVEGIQALEGLGFLQRQKLMTMRKRLRE